MNKNIEKKRKIIYNIIKKNILRKCGEVDES